MRFRQFAPLCGVVLLCPAAVHAAAIFTGEDRIASLEIAGGFDATKNSTLNDFSDGNQSISLTHDDGTLTATASVTAVTSYSPTQYNFNILDVSDTDLHTGRSFTNNAFFDSDLGFHLDTDTAYDASGILAFTQATSTDGLGPNQSFEIRLLQNGSDIRTLFLTTSGPFDFAGVLPAGDYGVHMSVIAQSGVPSGTPPTGTSDVSTSVIGSFAVPEPTGLATLAITAAAATT
ncbi:MAG TPA: hypothetical protein VLI90_03400, partial [Tepidisphaeraceae bacterium]|nr:hypothetical protein [Tepidisphaeraceae bacterium]